ncbi:hypothetical protein E2F46_11685 [Luteimonas aestuarii]|uniref:Uncharacterized protein n=1 Tax=Luteimonas aestuarii TaxID=453837 RepID=A0A4R5TR43_9GAMM|nr:hypothetical protein [Luteimonas aestuarii]TDK23262.1 hypothetical protein E2F46_11685 [Luteimonas aestuarii]
MAQAHPGAPPEPRTVRGFVLFKWLVYALLAANVVLYAHAGTATETIDTAAWMVLLLMFEWETGGWHLPTWSRTASRALRAIASLAVLWACIDYGLSGEWLDFANASAWLGVVFALELEVRLPARRRYLHHVRRASSWVLYLALAGFAIAWWLLALRVGDAGDWLDAWDATLWLAAFLAIELNVFGLASRQPRMRDAP